MPYGHQAESQVALQAMTEHPVMRHVNIDSLFVQKATAIQPNESVEVLLEGSRTPLVMSWEEQGVPSRTRCLRSNTVDLAV